MTGMTAHKKGALVEYDKPQIEDYGSIEELTAALCLSGQEDAGNKQFHSTAPCD